MPTRRTFAASAAALPLLAACQSGQDPHVAPGWRSAPAAPYAVQEIYPVLHDGAIWIAGGFSPRALGATEAVIVLDIAADAWRVGPPLPTPSHHVHLASLGGDLWAIGGFIGGASRRDWRCTARVLKLEGEAWVEGPPLPKPIGEAVPLMYEGRIHLIGGRSPSGEANAAWDDQADVADHFVLLTGAAQWERAAPLPLPRNSAAGAVLDGALHVISGRTVAGGQTPAHHVYDPRSDSWREAAPFPEARGGLAAAALSGRIIAGGGEIFAPGSVGDALYAFDGEAWTRFGTMPTPRHGFGMIATNDALFVMGGAHRVGGNGTLASVDVLA
jgi:hypothetical protein